MSGMDQKNSYVVICGMFGWFAGDSANRAVLLALSSGPRRVFQVVNIPVLAQDKVAVAPVMFVFPSIVAGPFCRLHGRYAWFDSGYIFCVRFMVISHIFFVKVEFWILRSILVFFLHTWPMREWPRSSSVRQWHAIAGLLVKLHFVLCSLRRRQAQLWTRLWACLSWFNDRCCGPDSAYCLEVDVAVLSQRQVPAVGLDRWDEG